MIAVLYVIIRNDQVSQFEGVEKKFFYKVYFNNVDFITKGLVNGSGSPDDLHGDFASDPETETNALCFVIRADFRYVSKHKQTCVSIQNNCRNITITKSYIGNILANHKQLLEVIRGKIWPRVTPESQLPPSITALQRHTWRAILYWRQMSNPHATPLDAVGTAL